MSPTLTVCPRFDFSRSKSQMVLPARFQRAAFRLGGGRSMQLSYGSTLHRKLADGLWDCPVERGSIRSIGGPHSLFRCCDATR